ncbi:hypothetical protein EI555_012311, partial [Monodon monoceros]
MFPQSRHPAGRAPPPFVFRLACLHVNAAPVPARLEVAPATLETRSVRGFSSLVPGVIIAPTPHQAAGQPFKFTIPESLDRIKEEFQFLQAQYHRCVSGRARLKLECEKLASEKTEMQRHYVMYYEMSYGLNIEMHKQTEIAKRLNTICAQVIPFLSQEHQQQVAQAVERAKQVTMAELNAIIGPPGIPPLGGSAGLLALSSALSGQSHLAIKDDKKHHDAEHHRGPFLAVEASHQGLENEEHFENMLLEKSNSLLVPDSLRGTDKRRNGPEFSNDIKKRKVDDKDSSHYDSDGDKSDDNLVVDVSNEGKWDRQKPSAKERRLQQPGIHRLLGKFHFFEIQRNELAAGLRTPLAVPGPYPAPFGMVPHAGMNGELTSPSAAYASLHNMSPQMSAAAAAAAVVAYGRSPMVGFDPPPHMRVPTIPPNLAGIPGGKPVGVSLLMGPMSPLESRVSKVVPMWKL